MATQTHSPTQTATAPGVQRSGILVRVVVAFGLVAVLSALIGVVLSGASYEPAPGGLPDAGPIVGWLLPVVGALTFVCAMATVGWLLLAGFLDPAAGKTTVSKRGRTALLRASAAAGIWCIISLVAAVFKLASILGIDLGTAVGPSTFITYAWDIIDVRTLLICALLAAIISVGAAISVSLNGTTVWFGLAVAAVAIPAMAGHAAGLGDHGLALVNGVAHAVAATVWVGGLIALGATVWPKAETVGIAARRFGLLAMACVIVLVASGIANAYVRLGSPADLVTSGYGRLVLAKSALLIALVAIAAWIRKRLLPQLTGEQPRRTFAKVAGLELALMGIASGLGVALSVTAPTRVAVEFPTQAEALLGFVFPAAPSASSLILGWDFDALFLVLGIVACVYYSIGVARLRARGDHWPISRTICWFIGWGIVIWATNAGLATYAEVSVGIHMIQHMTLTMMAPIFLVLAGPVTLALRALKPSPTGGRGPRELLMGGLHSTLARFFTNPITILVIYVLGLYGLYLTNVFGSLMSSHIGHIVMTTHFLVAGILLAYVAIGIDPKPTPLPFWGRMMLVLAAIILHTFFAVVMMSSTTLIGATWYSQVRPPWLIDPVKDSMLGGQIAWGVGEIPTLIMMIIIAVQWARSDERESKRRDRFTNDHGDHELDDYNAYLTKLNELNAQAKK